MLKAATWALLMTCCVGVFAPASAQSLPSVLDTPAMRSRLAAVQPLNGITRAGKRLVAVGRRGIIVYSNNGGLGWQQAEAPVSSDLTAITFATPTLGWAVGHDAVILATRDGGLHWQRQFDARRLAQSLKQYSAQLASKKTDAALLEEIQRLTDDASAQSFMDVGFVSDRVGYAVGGFNLIYRTDDGGANWQPMFADTENPNGLHLYSIRNIPDKNGIADVYIAGEQGLVLKLDRASGRFVARKTPYEGTYFGIVGDRNAVLAYGLRGNAWRSTDGGASWQRVPAGPEVSLTGSSVLADGKWVLVNMAGMVLVSGDSGQTFAPAPIPPGIPYTGVADGGDGKLALSGLRGAAVLNFGAPGKTSGK
ncbi:WD40/YVTN/BNR-like repeat-containing protein [Lysobacter fragariae]